MKKPILIIIASIIAFGMGSACSNKADDHGHAHDEHGGHGDGHGHSATKTLKTNVVVDSLELYAEYGPLVAGQQSTFAGHLTNLKNYRPTETTEAVIVLTGEDPGERFESTLGKPGLFDTVITPKFAGSRELLVLIKTAQGTKTFNFGSINVYKAVADTKDLKPTPTGEIEFQKSAQWTVDFETTVAQTRKMRPSRSMPATVRPASQGEAIVTAPFDGRISIPENATSQVGDKVIAGDVIAYVVPNLGASEIALLRSEVRKSSVQLDRAKRELNRVKGLASSGAIATKRVKDAESDMQIAQAERDQANRRLRQSQSMQSKGRNSAGRIAIRSPIDGTVAARHLVDGGFVKSGKKLLHVVDRSQLWLEAHVAEADLPHLPKPTGAWFLPSPTNREQIESLTQTPIEIDAASPGGLVSFGEIIDPHTRTVPLIFAIGKNHNRDLKIGAFVKAHILTGEEKETLAIPSSSVLYEKGLNVVFVMKTGESFERRTVRLGIEDRNWVEVLDGLEPDERVVSTGAYYVKLAGTETAAMGHGHAH